VDFAVHSREVGPATVIAVSGELDIHTAPDLTEVLSPALAAGRPVVVDLTDVTFMDSSGLSVFVTALKRAREAGNSLGLVIAEPRVMRVFSITGIDTLIDIHATLDLAIAAT
jgi:anti-sigma B factor antagonist